MNKNQELIQTLYEALQRLDYQTMQQCYHPQATFCDPVFGPLDNHEIKMMWKMLCQGAKKFSLTYDKITADESEGSSECTATYLFSMTNRKVVNRIRTHFRFQDGKIIEQHDDFNLWKWSGQAFGISGWLFGRFRFFQRKIQKKARERLEKFIKKKNIE